MIQAERFSGRILEFSGEMKRQQKSCLSEASSFLPRNKPNENSKSEASSVLRH
jgi:hypothetical protein